jgi:hypothetical protein
MLSPLAAATIHSSTLAAFPPPPPLLPNQPCTQVVEGDPSGIEPLLPLVVHGSLGAEDPSSLTPLHYQQLVRVGQACLDVLWEGGKAASEQLVRG